MYRVLIADDEAEVVELVKLYLEFVTLVLIPVLYELMCRKK